MPGMSSISTDTWPRRSVPVRSAVVVPGKFEVLARAPQSRLKSVVLPVFGLPTSRARSRTGVGCPATAGAVSRAGTGAIRALGGRRIRNHENPGRDGARDADARAANLQDAGLAGLAQAEFLA